VQNLLSARHELEEASEEISHASLDRAEAALTETVEQLREAIFELHPYVLEEAGLEAGLRSIAQHAAGRGGFDLRLDLRYDDQGSRDQLLFSAARELLANVVNHADAHLVTLRIAELNGEVQLVVEDDGLGFPPERLTDRLADGHVGLASQRIRVEAAGGRMFVLSAAGEGTRVEIRVPAG
jgi:two-component system NarL family sensor kinase